MISLSINPTSQSNFIQLRVSQPKSQATIEFEFYGYNKEDMSEISHRDAEDLRTFGEEHRRVVGQVERPREPSSEQQGCLLPWPAMASAACSNVWVFTACPFPPPPKSFRL
jgi:hypothetical protein